MPCIHYWSYVQPSGLISICIGLVLLPDLCLKRARRDKWRSPWAHLMPFHCSLCQYATVTHDSVLHKNWSTGGPWPLLHHQELPLGTPRTLCMAMAMVMQWPMINAASDQACWACCRPHCVSLPLRHGPLVPLDTMTLMHCLYIINCSYGWILSIYLQYIINILSISSQSGGLQNWQYWVNKSMILICPPKKSICCVDPMQDLPGDEPLLALSWA